MVYRASGTKSDQWTLRSRHDRNAHYAGRLFDYRRIDLVGGDHHRQRYPASRADPHRGQRSVGRGALLDRDLCAVATNPAWAIDAALIPAA